jgi:hypothetical protein
MEDKSVGRGHGRDRMVVGFITTYAISAYHNVYLHDIKF